MCPVNKEILLLPFQSAGNLFLFLALLPVKLLVLAPPVQYSLDVVREAIFALFQPLRIKYEG